MASENRFGPRVEPMYTIGEAAHLAHVSPGTVRNWLYGYAPDAKHPNWRQPPVFAERDKTSPYVSFLQLIEIVLAADFRKVGHVRLDVVRGAHLKARTQFDIEYPFAHRDLHLESLGGHIVRWIGGSLAQAVDAPEQFSLPGLVAGRVAQLDYDQSLAARWFPLGKDVPIVIDPLFSAGLPTVYGRGVTVEAIHRRWQSDPDLGIDFIADDLQLDRLVIERVLKYAEKVAA